MKDELKEEESVETVWKCTRCMRTHPIEQSEGVSEDGTVTQNILQFVTCGDVSFVVGIRGKRFK